MITQCFVISFETMFVTPIIELYTISDIKANETTFLCVVYVTTLSIPQIMRCRTTKN
jgi:hypothetical protein